MEMHLCAVQLLHQHSKVTQQINIPLFLNIYSLILVILIAVFFAAKYSYLSNSCMQKQEFHFFCNFFDMLPEAFSPLVKQRQKSISAFHQRWKFFWDLSISNKDFRMFRSKISHFVFIADVGLARQKQLLCCYYKVKFDTFSCKRYPNMNFHKGLTLPHLQKVSKLSFVWGRIDC